jgi:hypothetical protein
MKRTDLDRVLEVIDKLPQWYMRPMGNMEFIFRKV